MVLSKVHRIYIYIYIVYNEMILSIPAWSSISSNWITDNGDELYTCSCWTCFTFTLQGGYTFQ